MTRTRIFLPPRLSRELAEASAAREAQAREALIGQEVSGHQFRWKQEFDAQLERIVHGMRLVFCPDPAPLDAAAQGAVPGRWHLIWPGFHGGPLNVQPLVIDPDTGRPRIGGWGEFVEPGSWVFERIAAADMWDERVMRDRRRIQREAEEAKRRREEKERADFDQDCLEHWRSVSRTQVSMNRDTAWGQNAKGAAAARAQRKKERDRGNPDAG